MTGSPSASEICSLLVATSTRLRLYGRGHELTRRALADLEGRLETVLARDGELRLLVRGDDVLCNGEGLARGPGLGSGIARRFAAGGLGQVLLLPGVSSDEILDFCAGWERPATDGLKASAHVRLAEATLAPTGGGGELEALRVREAPEGRGRGGPLPEGGEEGRVEELLRQVHEHQEIRFRSFEEVVLSFLGRFARQKGLLRRLAELRGHDRATYLHTSNVANLAIGFALSLGVDRRHVYRIGIAALLHDVGKSVVPVEILNKTSAPTEREWEIIRRHPVEGARILAKQKELPRLAIVVAFEHHLHYAGPGGYPRFDPPRRPGLEAQLVSIADTFDALFGNRSYHRSFDVLEAIDVLEGERGRTYNPWLVDSFSRYITTDLEGGGAAAA